MATFTVLEFMYGFMEIQKERDMSKAVESYQYRFHAYTLSLDSNVNNMFNFVKTDFDSDPIIVVQKLITDYVLYSKKNVLDEYSVISLAGRLFEAINSWASKIDYSKYSQLSVDDMQAFLSQFIISFYVNTVNSVTILNVVFDLRPPVVDLTVRHCLYHSSCRLNILQ